MVHESSRPFLGIGDVGSRILVTLNHLERPPGNGCVLGQVKVYPGWQFPGLIPENRMQTQCTSGCLRTRKSAGPHTIVPIFQKTGLMPQQDSLAGSVNVAVRSVFPTAASGVKFSCPQLPARLSQVERTALHLL